jgi:predicted RecA/RadA family phage recombinase
MKNYDSPGDFRKFTAPTGGVLSGKAFKIGSFIGVATGDADAGAPFEMGLVGCFFVTKPDDEDWAEGDKIYFHEVPSPVGASYFSTAVGSPAGILVGAAAAVATLSPPTTEGLVRLDGAVR